VTSKPLHAKSSTCGSDPLLAESVLQARHTRYVELRAAFDRMLEATELSSRGDELVVQFLEWAAPPLGPISEEVAGRLQQKLKARNPGQGAEEVSLRLKRNPCAELDAIRQRLLNLGSNSARLRANDTHWRNFIIFKYLSDIAMGYQTVLLDVVGSDSSSALELRLHVGLFDGLPANVGIRFETQRLRHFLTVMQLAKKRLPKFPGRRIEPDAIGFFTRIYGHLKDAGVLYMPEFRKYDEPLVKAIYKQCGAEARNDVDSVLPPRRSDVTTYNVSGGSKATRPSRVSNALP
jgi:hypothetical protein